jgi:hypothetical protein
VAEQHGKLACWAK